MRTGITQEQVNATADAILGTGENPTVEKIRAALGTGSPNTVTRMLDAWRNRLGERLRELSTLPGLPDSVGQAMLELWRLATEHAERALEGRFTDEHANVESARAALVQEQERWELRLQAADIDIAQARTARDLAEHACAALDSQLHDSHALRADLGQQRDRLQSVCDDQALEIKNLRVQVEERDAALRENRAHQETYLRAVEDRAHQEIDRARQDAKQWQHRFEALERTHHTAAASIQAEHDAVRDQLRKAENEVARYTGIVSGLEKALPKTRPDSPGRSRTKGVDVRVVKKSSRQKKPPGKTTK